MMNLHAELSQQVRSLKRQVRTLQAGMLLLACTVLLAAMPGARDVIRTKGLIVVDSQGHERILLGAPVPSVTGRIVAPTESLVFRSESGADRVILGESPSPVIHGQVYPRVGKAWGMVLANPAGDERGGVSYLDSGRVAFALDRPTGDAIGLLVDDKTGFAGMLVNYDSGKLGIYSGALRVGTSGSHVLVEATNVDGSPAGALTAGAGGRAVISDAAP
jgi:hypothetical protein